MFEIFVQLQDCGMILEEQPAKVVEAFRLFLQGNGYGKLLDNFLFLIIVSVKWILLYF